MRVAQRILVHLENLVQLPITEPLISPNYCHHYMNVFHHKFSQRYSILSHWLICVYYPLWSENFLARKKRHRVNYCVSFRNDIQHLCTITRKQVVGKSNQLVRQFFVITTNYNVRSWFRVRRISILNMKRSLGQQYINRFSWYLLLVLYPKLVNVRPEPSECRMLGQQLKSFKIDRSTHNKTNSFSKKML